MIADGDLVLTHLAVSGFAPNPPMIFFDVYRIDEGKIVEHWDSNQFGRSPNPSGHTMIDGPTEVADHDKTDANRALVDAYMDQVAVPGRHERLQEFWRKDLIQHNPLMADGIRGFLEYRAAPPDANVPTRYTTRHSTIGEGNFVLKTAEVDIGGASYASTNCARAGWQDCRALGCPAADSAGQRQRQIRVLKSTRVVNTEPREEFVTD